MFPIMKKPLPPRTSFDLLPSVRLPVVPGSLGPLVPWSFGRLRAVVRSPLATCYRVAAPLNPLYIVGHAGGIYFNLPEKSIAVIVSGLWSIVPVVPGPFGLLVPWSFGPLLVALALCGCPLNAREPLRGGRAVTARNPAGGMSQVLLRGEPRKRQPPISGNRQIRTSPRRDQHSAFNSLPSRRHQLSTLNHQLSWSPSAKKPAPPPN